MRPILIVLIAQCLSLTTAAIAAAQETHETLQASRDATIAEGVRALSEDVRKLSDDVKELVALIKSQQSSPSIESNAPKTSEPLPATSQVPSSGTGDTNDVSNGRSVQSTESDRTKWLSKLDEQLSKLNGGEVPEQQVVLDAQFRDLSLVEAKTIALKAYRESRSAVENANDEFASIKDEQNLLKSVEDKYWDLSASYDVFDAYKRSSEAILSFWRVEVDQKGVGHEFEQQIANLWRQNQNVLSASLNGSAIPPRTRGLLQAELALRSTLGLSISEVKLRPTDKPVLIATELDWSTLIAMVLKENVYLKQKRKAIDRAPIGKPRKQIEDELKASELMLEFEARNCYQNKVTSYDELNLSRDHWKACEREIEIYHERLKDKVGDRHLLLDNIARAHQRRALAETQHHQAASEYNKALTNMKYLCSQLTVGTDASQK